MMPDVRVKRVNVNTVALELLKLCETHDLDMGAVEAVLDRASLLATTWGNQVPIAEARQSYQRRHSIHLGHRHKKGFEPEAWPVNSLDFVRDAMRNRGLK